MVTSPSPALIETIRALAESTFRARPNQVRPVPAGLGDRLFFRIEFAEPMALGGDRIQSAIARVEPPPPPPPPSPAAAPKPADPAFWLAEPPLEPIRRFLESAGLPVPKTYARAEAQGLELIEDLGDRTLLDLEGEAREDGYAAAIELIAALQALEAPAPALPAFERRFGSALLRTKAWKFEHWAWPGLVGRDPDRETSAAIRAGFDWIANRLAAAPLRLSHRDFKAENLHVRPGTEADLVMIDLQGAFMAPPEYDLVCLLLDLQAPLAPAWIDSQRERAFGRLDWVEDPEISLERFQLLGLVRLAKDVSHLVHAGQHRGDRRRWHEIPRGLALLQSVSGALQTRFPEIRALHNVIEVLSEAALSADTQLSGMDS